MHQSTTALLLSALCLSSTVVAGPLLQRSTCPHDNCLRALLGHSDLATPFCTSYLQNATSTIPSYASSCSSAPAASSACACLPSEIPSPTCKATSFYSGWSSIKNAFIFGDSYTSTSFNYTGIQPSAGNPLGNPPYPGWNSANGPNWVDFLTVKYNDSLLLTYNLAVGGATVDSALVAPYLPTVYSVSQQIENWFFPGYASGPAAPVWSSSDTLFGVWIGINDVGNSWYRGVDAYTALNKAIFAVYGGLMEMLYQAGARNFLFLTVPPVDRSPLMLAQSTDDQAAEKVDIAAFNSAILALAKNLKSTHSDVNIFTLDTNILFTEVLDKPSSFPQTALYQNTTAYCTAYQNGTPLPDTYDPTCGVPVNEYFWLNSLHPTYPMHDVVAEKAGELLESGPNVC